MWPMPSGLGPLSWGGKTFRFPLLFHWLTGVFSLDAHNDLKKVLKA